MQTTTTLRSDLAQRLTALGLTDSKAATLADLLPDAGQHELIAWLRDSENPVDEIRRTYRDTLAARLRTSTADADRVLKLMAVAR